MRKIFLVNLMEEMVGALGFEPRASCTPCKHASRTAPRPDGVIIVAVHKFDNLFGLSFLSYPFRLSRVENHFC